VVGHSTNAHVATGPFQSPSRGGHLRGPHCNPIRGKGANCFSPLHEGDTSVVPRTLCFVLFSLAFQSPSRGGHLRGVAGRASNPVIQHVSVPFTRGTPPWCQRCQQCYSHRGVSVPFTRGTPPWSGDHTVRRAAAQPFQSPSRGGHLRGADTQTPFEACFHRFSPLHEGDTSVVPRVLGTQRRI